VKSAQPSQRVADQFDPLFWWFRSIRLKLGKTHIVLPSGKLMFLFSVSLLFWTVYVRAPKESCWLEEVKSFSVDNMIQGTMSVLML
jgi:hypothetical protein